MYTVLIPVDRNRNRARHQAEYVAGLPGDPGEIEATVLYVFPHQDYKGAPPHEFEEVDAAVASADHLENAGHPVERTAVGGEVARTILATAEEVDVDGLVAGGRKRSGVAGVLLGSTVRDVMLSAERPVTVHRLTALSAGARRVRPHSPDARRETPNPVTALARVWTTGRTTCSPPRRSTRGAPPRPTSCARRRSSTTSARPPTSSPNSPHRRAGRS